MVALGVPPKLVVLNVEVVVVGVEVVVDVEKEVQKVMVAVAVVKKSASFLVVEISKKPAQLVRVLAVVSEVVVEGLAMACLVAPK